MLCPDCEATLDHGAGPSGAVWICSVCGGHTLGIAQLRELAGAGPAGRVWRSAQESVAGRRACPGCRLPMAAVGPSPPEVTFAMEVCRNCHVVWLDRTEFNRLGRTNQVPEADDREIEDEAVAEIMARAESERIARRAQAGSADRGPPPHWWQWVLGLGGFPIQDDFSMRRVPVATVTVSVVIVAVSLWGFTALPETVERLGLVPARPGRLAGLTLIIHFFVHGGWAHLLGNLYVLVLLGNHIEDRLGSARFVVIVVAAAVTGALTHVLLDPRPEIPVVGASGGISGLLVFYAVASPRARFHFLFFWLLPPVLRWVRLSAAAFAGLWAFFQLIGGFLQLGGWGGVSALAHLGGAIAGLVLGLAWRRDVPVRAAELVS